MAKKLCEKYDDIVGISYVILDPINVIFTAVKDLREIVELPGKPYSEMQIIEIGHIMIGNHNIFWSDIHRWIRHRHKSTCVKNFTDHFTSAHAKLRETYASVDKLGYQKSSAIVSHIIEPLRAQTATYNNQPRPPYNLLQDYQEPLVTQFLAEPSPVPDPHPPIVP